MKKVNEAKFQGLTILLILVVIFCISAYLYGKYIGEAQGRDSAKTTYEPQLKVKDSTINSLTQENIDLTTQYNQLSDNYNTLRNAVIKYAGSAGSYQPSTHLNCTSMSYGIENQFTSTNCY